MGKPIATTKIGQDLYSDFDAIWQDAVGPNASTVTSPTFMLAQTLGATQLNLVGGTAGFSTGGSNVVTVTIVTDPVEGGTFATTVFSKALPVSTDYADGEIIASFIPPRELSDMYAQIKVTVATDDLSGEDLTAYQVAV